MHPLEKIQEHLLASWSGRVQAGGPSGTETMAFMPHSQSPPHPLPGCSAPAWHVSFNSAQKIGLASQCIVSKPFGFISERVTR